MVRQSEIYAALYTRNGPIIGRLLQDKISQLRVGVAGCGSTGGAVVDGAIRLGVQHFHLCDNGAYEAANLNRQLVSQNEIGVNKAVAYGARVKAINPEATTRIWDEGLTNANIDEFLNGLDFLFDAVDVTTPEGMRMKLLLHEKAAEKKIATGSALDLAYVQWLQSYNYHLGEKPLHGRLEAARAVQNPLKSLLVGFSAVEELPLEISDEIIRLVETPGSNACQLACVCFVLAGMITPMLLHFVKEGRLPPLAVIDLMAYFESPEDKTKRSVLTVRSHARLKELLSKLS